jgi:hypothetical protein
MEHFVHITSVEWQGLNPSFSLMKLSYFVGAFDIRVVTLHSPTPANEKNSYRRLGLA